MARSALPIFSQNLRRFLDASKMTQEAFADRLGVTRVSVVGYLAGQTWPRIDVFNAICQTLKVRPWQLLAEEGEADVIPPELVDHVAAAARACGLKVSKGNGG